MADIVFVVAPIGGGKSLYGCRAICEELGRTDRDIVTNLPVFIQETPDESHMTLGEWCHEYIEREIDIKRRVRKLTDGEMWEFYRHYVGWDMPDGLVEVPAKGGKGVETEEGPDLQMRMDRIRSGEMSMGTLFVLDEVHNFFSARSWQKVSRGVELYMSQLRKFNDDLLLITQHPEKVDKNFRRNATEWIYLKNLGRTRLWAGVSLKGRFRFETYSEQPRFGDKPSTAGFMQLQDKDYHKVYDTMAGVGLTGKLAPEKSRWEGRGWWLWVVIGVVGLLGCWFLPRWGLAASGKIVSHSLGGFREGATASVTKAQQSFVPSVVPMAPPAAVSVAAERSAADLGAGRGRGISQLSRLQGSSPVWQSDVIVSGYAVVSGQVDVYLSDGSRYFVGDGHCKSFDGEVAEVDGVMYRFLSIPERVHWERLHGVAETVAGPTGSPWGTLGEKSHVVGGVPSGSVVGRLPRGGAVLGP
jgi:hypothetical protein